MRAGPLRHRIEVQSVTETRAVDGGVVQTWTTDHVRNGNIIPLEGRELFNAMAVDETITHRIEFRWFDGLTSKQRLKFRDRIFNILAPPRNLEERDRELHVMVKEDG